MDAPVSSACCSSIADAYHEKNEDVMEQAKMVEAAISQAESFAGAEGEFSPAVIDAIVKSALEMFDPQHGGFGSAPKFPHPGGDRFADRPIHAHRRREICATCLSTTLEKMARGGVYDQLAGGFHRYSVDERWVVPHFEKMCYDNSELLKNYVHAYQATGFGVFCRSGARHHPLDGRMAERPRARRLLCLAGRRLSPWTTTAITLPGRWRKRGRCSPRRKPRVACLYYDINEIGEMHHNPAKNVLYVRASVEEIAKRLSLPLSQVATCCDRRSRKCTPRGLQRPTPYVDKTVYTGWNALCVSAYLEAAKVLGLDAARHFALRSLDRILAEGWHGSSGLLTCWLIRMPQAERRPFPACWMIMHSRGGVPGRLRIDGRPQLLQFCPAHRGRHDRAIL